MLLWRPRAWNQTSQTHSNPVESQYCANALQLDSGLWPQGGNPWGDIPSQSCPVRSLTCHALQKLWGTRGNSTDKSRSQQGHGPSRSLLTGAAVVWGPSGREGRLEASFLQNQGGVPPQGQKAHKWQPSCHLRPGQSLAALGSQLCSAGPGRGEAPSANQSQPHPAPGPGLDHCQSPFYSTPWATGARQVGGAQREKEPIRPVAEGPQSHGVGRGWHGSGQWQLGWGLGRFSSGMLDPTPSVGRGPVISSTPCKFPPCLLHTPLTKISGYRANWIAQYITIW